MDLSLQESVLVIVSVLLTATAFNVALYFGYGKKVAYLFFAFYCLFHCFKIYLKTYPEEQELIPFLSLNGYELVYISVILGMLSLSVFLAYYFTIPYRRQFVAFYLASAVLYFFFLHELEFIKFSLIIALAQSIYVVVKYSKGYLVLLGILGFAFCVWLGWQGALNYGYFVGAIFLILCMVLSSSIELARQNREYNETIIRASRLENQLLKSTIQPHFIMNSLTSLQELIEQEPSKASKFVLELSRVFELFAKISDRKLIPINDELDLISAYLEIMGVRKNISFQLERIDLTEDDAIPPGVLLTLVENGLTHGYEDREEGRFSIARKEDDSTLTYSVFNDGKASSGASNNGTGINYVISRLKESYADRFDFQSYPDSNGWLSTITLWK